MGRSLGRGAVATVFTVDGRDGLAIKLLNAERAERSPLSAERFLREARAAARLSHPNIVGVVDHGTDANGVAFLVMEEVRGDTLGACIAAGPMSPTDAATLAGQLADALSHAHARGVIHRDVKPANVLIEDGEELVARLTDFGLAHDRHDLPLTATGALCGTPAYMAPELVDGARPSAASDLYALGCVLFEMLTGRAPFVGALPHVFRGHAYEPAPVPSTLRADVPPALDALVQRLLAKDPAARPSVGEVRSAAHEANDPVGVWTRRVSAARERAVERCGEPLPAPVEDALAKLDRALARLTVSPSTVVAGTTTDTVARPGAVQALAQLELHREQLRRALGVALED